MSDDVPNDENVLHVLPPVDADERTSVSDPARALRAATAVRGVLEEVRGVELDDRVRDRLASLLDRTREEMSSLVTTDLARQLEGLDLPDAETASTSELRLALAELLGWLEGLFHGVSADLVATEAELPTDRSGHYL